MKFATVGMAISSARHRVKADALTTIPGCRRTVEVLMMSVVWKLNGVGFLCTVVFALPAVGARRVDMGTDATQVYELDVDSIRRVGKIVEYRLYSRSRARQQADYEGRLGVDCLDGTRIEYESVTRYADHVARSEAMVPDMKPVLGPRQNSELQFVCGQAALADEERIFLAQRAKSSATRLKSVSSAFAVSEAGYYVTQAKAVAGCGRVDLLTDDRSRPVRVVAENHDIDMAVLRVFGWVPHALSESGLASTAGTPLLALGFARAQPFRQNPRIAAAVVLKGPEMAGQIRVAIGARVEPISGPLLDAQGGVLGMALGTAEAGGRHQVVWGVSAFAIRNQLLRSGVMWRRADSVGDSSGSPVLALRRGLPGLARVGCYTKA